MKGHSSGAVTNNGKSHLYDIWESMKRRCENPNMQNYKYYGGRGIRVCAEWHSFESFLNWAESHGYADGLSIDRIDNNSNYSPDNCQWISPADNTRKSLEEIIRVDGVEGNLSAWARLLGVSKSVISYHMNGKGEPVHEWIHKQISKRAILPFTQSAPTQAVAA